MVLSIVCETEMRWRIKQSELSSYLALGIHLLKFLGNGLDFLHLGLADEDVLDQPSTCLERLNPIVRSFSSRKNEIGAHGGAGPGAWSVTGHGSDTPKRIWPSQSGIVFRGFLRTYASWSPF